MKTPAVITENKTLADALAALRAEIKVGIDQLDRGEGAEWNAEEIKTKGRALAAARKCSAVQSHHTSSE